MPRISRIQNDTTVEASDKLLGTDTSGATKNFTIEQIANYVNNDVSAGTYKHNQNSPSTTWTITHNLNLEDYLPVISVKMSGGVSYDNVQAMGVVSYVTKNQLTIEFATQQSGYAYLKK